MPINEIDIEPLPSGQIGITLDIEQGVPGPVNTLSIGSVTSGVTPSATITGSAPAQTLNLVLPKGDTGSTGLKGDKGDTGDAGQDGADALWNYTGAYSGGTAYAVGDLAVFNGQLFYRKDSHGGNTGDPPFNGSQFWDLLAAKGDTGETGLQGEQGPAGADALWNFRGDWWNGSNTSWQVGDVAIDSGSLYYCTQSYNYDNIIGPQRPSEWSNHWELIAAKGDTGETGATGLTGDQGPQGPIGLTGPAGPEPSLNVTDNSATSITLSDANNNSIVHCTAATAVTITVPSTLAAGFSCMVIQAGAGQVTFQAGSGTTLNSFGALLRTAGQHAPASLIRVGAGIYNLSGNLV